ncbi:MAG: ribosome small subunit-dependent GTPase A [Myxococcota bacterium]
MSLEELGWTADQQAELDERHAEGLRPARICLELRGEYRIWDAEGEHRAVAAGALQHEGDRPVVGDWVLVLPPEGGTAVIKQMLPRRSLLQRKAAGRRTEVQVMVANVTTVFITMALDRDLNVRRLERYVTAVRDGGATPVVLLNKWDLHPDLVTAQREVVDASGNASVHLVSAASGAGLASLADYLAPGATVVLVGSSGVGKSTLINRLANTEQAVQRYGVDGRGKHTTTTRQMFRLSHGAFLIDTPGMRELGLLGEETVGLDASFDDVAVLAEACRFRDCEHVDEPGCAVQAAIEDETLPAERLEGFRKLQRELRHMAERQDGKVRLEERRRRKAFQRMARARTKHKEKSRWDDS